MRKIKPLVVVFTFIYGIILPAGVAAVPLTSPNYKLDPQGLNAVGGQGASTNYKMVSSGGEAVVGSGSGGSYKLSSGYVGQLQQSIEVNLLQTGLVAYYPLDTNTGVQAYDTTTNNHHAAFVGTPSWQPGKLGSSLFTNSTSNYAAAADSNALDLTGDFTISVWVKPSIATQTANASVVTKIQSTNTNYRIGYDSTGTRFRLAIGGDGISSTTLGTSTSQWYHVVGVREGTTIKMYVNGTLEDSKVSAITPAANAGLLTIGGLTKYEGNIDEVRIYNRALSTNEVRGVYDANMAGIREAITIPQVVPGIPQTIGMDMIVITDAGGYDAAISQNNNLTHSDAATTIAASSAGSITTPGLWDDGTTKGLGFTITGGLSVPVKWGTGPVNYKYAALSNSATTFFSRTGLSGGQKETTNLQFKLDVPTGQKPGQYSNITTVTATLKP